MVGAVRGPGIPKGIYTYEKHHATDWMPTLVSMASGMAWTHFIPVGEPPYLPGDGVNNWPMLRAGGVPGSSARDWLLYETHPRGQTSRTHGDAFVLGDLKIVKTAQVCPQDENGWHVPPGEEGQTVNYFIAEKCSLPLRVGKANSSECKDDWCLFNISADACEYHNLANDLPHEVQRLVARLNAFQVTAVRDIEPEGCEPVALPNSVWNPNFEGNSWQPCDGPMTPHGHTVPQPIWDREQLFSESRDWNL